MLLVQPAEDEAEKKETPVKINFEDIDIDSALSQALKGLGDF